jgi:flagellar export protein FliJ
MKKFAFRLERVLDLRRLEADMEQNKLATLEAEMERLRDRLRSLADAYQHQVSVVSTDPYERTLLNGYRLHFESTHRQVEADLAQRQLAADLQRAKYIAARQKVEVLEKVKRNQKEDWERQLQKELDDMAMDSFLARWSPPSTSRQQ